MLLLYLDRWSRLTHFIHILYSISFSFLYLSKFVANPFWMCIGTTFLCLEVLNFCDLVFHWNFKEYLNITKNWNANKWDLLLFFWIYVYNWAYNICSLNDITIKCPNGCDVTEQFMLCEHRKYVLMYIYIAIFNATYIHYVYIFII